MRIAYMGSNYCRQFHPAPDGHESVWMPYAPALADAFAAVGLTPDWADVMVVALAETYPLPLDLESCPCPTVAVLVDWQQWADALMAHANAFDRILVDGSGAAGLSRYFPEKVRTFSPMGNFSGVAPDDPPTPLADREHDVAFIGRFTPAEQYSARVQGLGALYPLAARHDVRILRGLSPQEYRDALCSTKIIVNHAAWPVQQGMNARNIEASVCGALILSESTNLGVSAYFGQDEALFYDDNTLADRISWALTHLDEAQAMADKARQKAGEPRAAEYLALLDDVVSNPPADRGARTAHDLLIGLCCAFGNWGPQSTRPPGVLQAMLDIAANTTPELADDPRWQELLGVAFAEVTAELDHLGEPDQAEQLRNNPTLAPEASFNRAIAADPTAAHPLYNLGRYWMVRRQWRRGAEALGHARDLLTTLGPAAIRSPAIVYPVRATDVASLDRTLAFHLNATPFLPHGGVTSDARQAALLLWRTSELLGDLAQLQRRPEAARDMYEAAANACPDIATSALRKLIELASLAEEAEQADRQMSYCRRIVAINPLDLEHRELFISLSRSAGTPDADFEDDTSLLRKALGSQTQLPPDPVYRL